MYISISFLRFFAHAPPSFVQRLSLPFESTACPRCILWDFRPFLFAVLEALSFALRGVYSQELRANVWVQPVSKVQNRSNDSI
jgi:hypothetical protein